MKVSVSRNRVSGIDTHFKKYCISGIDTFGIISPITSMLCLCYVVRSCPMLVTTNLLALMFN